MVALGFIFWIVNLLLIGIFKIFFKAFQNFMNTIMKGLIIDQDVMKIFEKNEFIFQYTIAIGISLLGVITAYQGLKVMFTYMGFNPEDEPRAIFFRSAFLAFMIFASQDLSKYLFTIYGEIAKGAFSMLEGKDLSDIMFGGFLGALGGASVFFSVEMCLFIFLVFKVLSMCIKFGERFVLAIIISVFMPLAIACLSTKGTRDIGVGYFKLYFGNMVTQFAQIISLVVAYTFGDINPLDPKSWINFFYVIGIIIIIEKLDDIIGSVSLSAGLVSFQLDSVRNTFLNPSKEIGAYSVSGIKQGLKSFKP